MPLKRRKKHSITANRHRLRLGSGTPRNLSLHDHRDVHNQATTPVESQRFLHSCTPSNLSCMITGTSTTSLHPWPSLMASKICSFPSLFDSMSPLSPDPSAADNHRRRSWRQHVPEQYCGNSAVFLVCTVGTGLCRTTATPSMN